MRFVLYNPFSGLSDIYSVKFKILPIPKPSVNLEESSKYGITDVIEQPDGTILVNYNSNTPKLFLSAPAKEIRYTTNRATPTTSSDLYNKDTGIIPFDYVEGDEPLPVGSVTYIKAMSHSKNAGVTSTNLETYTGGPQYYTSDGYANIKMVKIGASVPAAPTVSAITVDGGTPTIAPSQGELNIKFKDEAKLQFGVSGNVTLLGKYFDTKPNTDNLGELEEITLGDADSYTLTKEMLNGKTEGWFVVMARNDAGNSDPLVIRFGLKGPDTPQIIFAKDVRPGSSHPNAPGSTTGFILSNGEYIIADGETFRPWFYSPVRGTFEYQMVTPVNGVWADTPDDNNWKTGLSKGSYHTVAADDIDACDTGRFFYRSGNKLDSNDENSPIVYSDYGYIDIQRLSPSKVAHIGASAWSTFKDGDLVRIDEDLRVMGWYNTNASGKPFYVYLMNSEGAVIKLVGIDNIGSVNPNSPADIYYAGLTLNTLRNNSALYQPGVAEPEQQLVIPARSIVGSVQFANGDANMPEIHLSSGTTSLLPLLGKPVVQNRTTTADAFALSAAGKSVQYPDSKTAVNMTADFNRYVELRSLTWTGANNMVQLAGGGGSLSVYGARLVTPDYTFAPDALEAGKMYRIKGFIGQAAGQPAIFPISEVEQCPGTPVLYAPNPVGEPEADGFVHLQAISDVVTFTVQGHADGKTAFSYKIGADSELQPCTGDNGNEVKVDLSEKADGDVVDLYVFGVLGDMTSLAPAKVRITRKNAEIVNSIYDYKKAMFANLSANIYQLNPESKVIVEEITPYYLYVRDYDEANPDGTANDPEGYLRRLLIHNDNGWNANIYDTDSMKDRHIVVGDLLKGFALKADERNGNMYSNSTGFARTFKYAGQDKAHAAKAEEREVNSLDANCTFTFADTDRMRLLTLKNVTVSKSGSGTDADPYNYKLNLAGGAKAHMRIGDPFEFRGGWQEAWAENAPFNITGVVLFDNDGSKTLAFAPLSFEGQRKLNTPAVYLSSIDEDKRGDTEQPFNTGSIVMTKPETAPADAKIYYSIDGLDPLNNLASRKTYDGEIELGDATVEIRAFVAAPGYTPSDVVVRRFTKSSHDVQFILNFLETAQIGQTYRFTGDTKIVAVGGDYIFVAGRVGHYLPIRLTGGWDNMTDIKPDAYLSGFTVTYGVDENGNRMGIADGFESTFKPVADNQNEIVPAPDETTALDFDTHPRRLVCLRNVKVSAPAEAAALADGDIAWTLTESGDGNTHALIPGKLGAVTIIERDSEGKEIAVSSEFVDGESYDITGFVMLNESREAAMEMWPVEATHLRTTGAVKASYSDGTIVDPAEEDGTIPVRFEGMTMVTLTCDTHNATIYYALGKNSDNLKWYEYQQRPIVVTADEYIHAKAIAPNAIESGHTHIALSALKQSGDVEFDVTSEYGCTTVRLTAAAGAAIWYSTGDDRSCTTRYNGTPLKFTADTRLYACAQAPGQSRGAVSAIHVAVIGTEAGSISGKVEISARLNEEGKPVVTITPADDTLAPGSYTIYYTLEEGVVLTPENGTEYTGEFTMQESGLVTALLVENGKSAGEPCSLNVWAGVTGIDGISGAEGESEVRVDGDSIIAPQGSEVYDLSGRRVNPTGLAGGIYIVRTPGGKAVKVRI
ncbi:MAG: chitobiase/beta-hexosaminidase C-terminal domain-containing protein [Paramuribaculum sp.]|nr:chitobiase/beta-hexosaminidase C-terminal domain-containing protein [Paramuribaculum sp.]